MTDAKSLYETIVGKYLNKPGVAQGKMMTAPALKYQNKVFVFFHEEQMCFKLGKDFDPSNHGIKSYSYLDPFKNKPPMKAWFYLPYSEGKLWDKMTNFALENIKPK